MSFSQRRNGAQQEYDGMARWPRRFWTTFFTYSAVFAGFPILCYLAYRFVRG